MASGAKEGTGESGSAARAAPLKAAVRSECPICLGAVRKPAYVAYCMHQFCFRCIRHWARARGDCPVCRQALEQVLHSVRGDDDYELFVVGLPARLRRRMATDRARSRFPQRRYDLRRRPATGPPAAGGNEPGGNEPSGNEPTRNEPTRNGTGSSQGQGAAPGPSRVPAQASPAAGPSEEPACGNGPGAPPDPRDGRE